MKGAGVVKCYRRLVDSCSSSRRCCIGSYGRSIRVRNVNGRHEVKISVKGVWSHIAKDHANSTSLRNCQALIDSRSGTPVAHYDFAGNERGVEHWHPTVINGGITKRDLCRIGAG